MEKYKQQNILSNWLFWHFYEVPKSLFFSWKNFLSFGLDFFSVHILILTLFSHWRRYKWTYPKGFSPRGYFEAFISNIFSRIIGAIVRFFLIIAGIAAEILILLVGAIVVLFWIVMPFIWVSLILLIFLI